MSESSARTATSASLHNNTNSKESQQHSLRSLIAAKKGTLTYKSGEAFLLHVFWIAPSLSKAQTLLQGLQQCAQATHRDTPCVPTYFFRPSQVNQESNCPSLASPYQYHDKYKIIHIC